MGLNVGKAPKELDGGQLLEELIAEGYQSAEDPIYNLIIDGDGTLNIGVRTASGGELTEASREKVQRIVAAHKPKPLRQRPVADPAVARLETLDKKAGPLTPPEVEEAVRLLLRGARPRPEV